MVPKVMVPQNGWFIRENPIEMDVFLERKAIFLKTPIYPFERGG